jgi:hypothetical protein
MLAGASICALFGGLSCCLFGPYLFGVQRFDEDAGAKKVADEIIAWTLPPEFKGLVGVTIDNMGFRFDIAKFTHEKGRGSLILVKLHWRAFPAPEELEIRKKMVENMIERIEPDLHLIDADERETRAVVICGIPGDCEIIHGEDRASTTKYRQAKSYLHDKTTDVCLILQCEDTFLSATDIDEFLQSIKPADSNLPK